MRWYQPVFFLSLLASVPLGACTANTGSAGGCARDSDCKGNRVCVNGQCVDPSGGNNNTGTGGNNNTGTGGNNNTGTGGNNNTGSGGNGNTGSSCSGTACTCAGGGGIDCCVQGTIKSYDCASTCADHGYESNGCQSDTCQCGAPTDTECANGVAALCKCDEWAGSSCTSTQETNMYENCHSGGSLAPWLKCWAQQINGSNIDCSSAQPACSQYSP